MKRLWIVLAVLALLGLVVVWLNLPTRVAPGTPVPDGGTYADLTPGQRRLIDDWVSRLSAAAGQSMDAAGLYNGLALSTRTTFNAVTHALSVTSLTSADGQPLNLTALDLIQRLDTVAGRRPGQGGDTQFRLYVELAPGAQAMLERSAQFTRQVDNTVYHQGYPICFRGAGGTPSIQFSLSRDGRFGDIDVDYRSSAFPVMLVNGHLTASNSDVRAGNNDERHNRHWAGLENWWRGFMGVPALEAPQDEAAAVTSQVSTAPRLGPDVRPEDAILDFFETWLMEDAPGVAVGYVAPRAFACLQIERGEAVDRGVARVQMARAMQSVGRAIGAPSTLADVIEPVTLTGPRGKAIRHAHGDLFALYELRDDLAAEFDCEARLDPGRADADLSGSLGFSGYLGAVFRVRAGGVEGEAVATVWRQQDEGWMLVGYDVEPEVRAAPRAAVVPAPVAGPAVELTEGDPDMIRAASDFLDAWLVRKDAAAAFATLSAETYACYNAFRPDEEAEAASTEEAARLLQERMRALADWVGPAKGLEDLLVRAEPHHPGLRLVKHDSPAFTVIALPDVLGDALACAGAAAALTPWVDLSGKSAYGRYYAASTRLRRAGEDAAVLWTVWAERASRWQVVSYRVLSP
jgi:hypothetical protein